VNARQGRSTELVLTPWIRNPLAARWLEQALESRLRVEDVPYA
jgi:hypothetical protein